MTIKVMIVDDSLFIRAVLQQIIKEDPKKRFEVVAAAVNGEDALEKLEKHEVDVITMDVEMPMKNGLETVKEIMKTNPKPIIMLSSLTKEGAKETLEALASGAIDFITKPVEKVDLVHLREELLEKLEMAYAIPAKKTLHIPYRKTIVSEPQKTIPTKKLTNLVVIGCSTGGPQALRQVLNQIPKNLPAAFVVVQHMPSGSYTKSMAEQINKTSLFHVHEGTQGEVLQDGHVYVAPGGFHLELKKDSRGYSIDINEKPPIGRLRPAVDITMNSLASLPFTVPVYGMLLTGMGKDGLEGCTNLREKGATILAQNSKTCVVYGMPKQIIDHGIAHYEEDLNMLIPVLTKLIL